MLTISMSTELVLALTLTFFWWSDGDGLCCELLVEVARVRLRADLGLERRNQLQQTKSLFTSISLLYDGAASNDYSPYWWIS